MIYKQHGCQNDPANPGCDRAPIVIRSCLRWRKSEENVERFPKKYKRARDENNDRVCDDLPGRHTRRSDHYKNRKAGYENAQKRRQFFQKCHDSVSSFPNSSSFR